MKPVMRFAMDPGDKVMIDGKEYIIKHWRGRFCEFTDGTEMCISPSPKRPLSSQAE